MTAVGAWTIGLALAYTVVLIAANSLVRRRADRGEGFFVASRSFGPWTVAFCITGLFSGSSYIAIMELSYRTGISAIWYGVAETVQVLLIALLLVKPLRRRMVVTVTGMIGERFGRIAQGIAGTITAVTFPMWSVATAIAFASALHVFTGLTIELAIIATALLLLLFLSAGGMRSVAVTQTANFAVFVAMLAVGVLAFVVDPGADALPRLAAERPEMFDLAAAGPTLIIAWFGTFIVNALLAQAAFQMALSCRTPAEGRRGMLYAAGLGVPFILIGVLLGVAAAIVVPAQELPLAAVPAYIGETLPAPLAGVFFLGIWACALGWAGPCQFSGATSLGRDVGRAVRPQATDADLVRYTRWSLVLLTGLMIVFALARAEESAWWNVLAWTLRNGATLAPVLAVLFWPLASRRAVYAAMLAGFVTGLSWYHYSGWSPATFLFGVHPVWAGMSVNLAVLVVVTLAGGSWRAVSSVRRRRLAAVSVTAGVVAAGSTIVLWGPLVALGLAGLCVFVSTVLIAISAFLLTERAPALPIDGEIRAEDEHGRNELLTRA